MESPDVLEYLRILGWKKDTTSRTIDGESFINRDGRNVIFALNKQTGQFNIICTNYPIINGKIVNQDPKALSFEEMYLFMQYIYMCRPDIFSKVFNKYREEN